MFMESLPCCMVQRGNVCWFPAIGASPQSSDYPSTQTRLHMWYRYCPVSSIVRNLMARQGDSTVSTRVTTPLAYKITIANKMSTLLCLYIHVSLVSETVERPKMQDISVRGNVETGHVLKYHYSPMKDSFYK